MSYPYQQRLTDAPTVTRHLRSLRDRDRGAVLPPLVLAYGGPGSVITGIGAFLAVLAAIAAAIFGFLWYPVKRLIRRFRGAPEQDSSGNPEALENAPTE